MDADKHDRGGRGLGLMLLAGPVAAALAIAPDWSFYYDVTPKAVLALIAGAVASALAARWPAGSLGCGPGRLFAAALALGAVSGVISALLSPDPALSWTGSAWRRLGLAVELALITWTLALAAWAAGAPRRILLALRAVAVATVAAAPYGILQYFGVDPLQDGELYHVGEGVWSIVRPPGTLGHAGYFATFLLHGVFSGATLALCDDQRLWRRLGASAAALAAVAIALSGTRSALVGLIAGAALLLAALRPRIGWRTAAVAAALAAAATAFYLSPPGERLRARTRWATEDVTGGRAPLWRDAAALGADHWATGVGLETFSAAFPPYQSLELTRVVPERYYESPHNVFLDAWATQGLPGVAALAGWLAAAAWAGFQARREQPRLAAGLLAGLVAALVSNQFLAFTIATKWFLLLQGALLVALATRTPPPSQSKQTTRRALAASGLIIAAAFGTAAFRLARADRALELVRRDFNQGRPEAAAAGYRRFLQIRPAGMYADLWFSREMLRNAVAVPPDLARRLWPPALAAAERAARRSETPHLARYNLAAFRAEQGDLESVESSLRAAIDAAPNWYPPYFMLARTLEEQGEIERALPLARCADELAGGSVDEVHAARRRIEAAAH